MAAADLKKTLEVIQKRMEMSSDAYRKLVSDKKVHNILVSEQRIKTQVKREVESRGGYKKGTLPESINKIIDDEVPKMCKGMFDAFKGYNTELKKTEVTDFKGDAKRFTFTIGAKPGLEANVFNRFREIKQVQQRPLLKKLKAAIRNLNRSRSDDNQIRNINSSFLDIGHQEGFSVSEQRAQEVNQALFDWGTNNNSPVVQKFLRELADRNNFVILRKPGKSKDVLTVALESKFLNRQRGGGAEKALIANINKDLAVILESFGGEFWAEHEGSDSKITKTTKEILNPLAKAAKRSSSIKTNFKEEKINSKKSTAKGKSKKRKVSKAKGFKDTTPVKLVKFSQGDKRSMFSIMAMINEKLPRVVEKNMGYPRLESQTGRFARSVKLTDVSQTRQGYPSFGYTYRTDPYAVFETGRGRAPWATPERDPRKLIDASIREIAGQMALGRFYTRRV